MTLSQDLKDLLEDFSRLSRQNLDELKDLQTKLQNKDKEVSRLKQKHSNDLNSLRLEIEGKKRSEEKESKRILELEEFNKYAQSTEIRLYDAELKVKFLEKENSRLKKQQEFYINKAREWKNRALKYERTLEDKGISVLTREKGKNQVNSIVHQFKCWPSFLGG